MSSNKLVNAAVDWARQGAQSTASMASVSADHSKYLLAKQLKNAAATGAKTAAIAMEAIAEQTEHAIKVKFIMQQCYFLTAQYKGSAW